ncbi:MAG TPA: WYL domain-containing protein [Parafilimonas sp.]|nr:WYL domain-containing protein [Parafilimonas sp.]
MHKLDTQVKHYKYDTGFISFQEAVIAGNYEYVDELYSAIANNTVVEFMYKPFTNEAKKRTVHPYFLKQYNNRWFLLGYNEGKESLSTFALDRIQGKIKPLSKTYILPDGIFNAQEYFKDIIGVTHYPGRPAEKIVIQCSGNVAPYILTKPIHTSQEIMQRCNDGGITISLFLKHNYELVNNLLGFGKDVTVLQPAALAEEIKMQAKEVLEKYGNNAPE